MKKFVVGPVLAALAMFMFGFLFWGIPHALPYNSLGSVPDESATLLSLGKLFPASGAYLLPDPRGAQDKVTELMKRGPLAEVHIRKEGMDPLSPGDMAGGYLQMLAIAIVLAVLLNRMTRAFDCWACRVKFCAMIGVLVAIGDLGATVWWHHQLSWTLWQALFDFVSYLIAGLVLACFVKPTPSPIPPAGAA